jgi:hypothetical protein
VLLVSPNVACLIQIMKLQWTVELVIHIVKRCSPMSLKFISGKKTMPMVRENVDFDPDVEFFSSASQSLRTRCDHGCLSIFVDNLSYF